MKDVFEHGKHVGTQCDACGKCCCVIMFPVDWLNIHRWRAVRPIIYTYYALSVAIPFTESGKCCFQLDNGKCVVHDDKPAVCINWNCTTDGGPKQGHDMKSWITHYFRTPNGKLWGLSHKLEAIDEDGDD